MNVNLRAEVGAVNSQIVVQSDIGTLDCGLAARPREITVNPLTTGVLALDNFGIHGQMLCSMGYDGGLSTCQAQEMQRSHPPSAISKSRCV